MILPAWNDVVQRLASRTVQLPSGCWEWTGARSAAGRGYLWWGPKRGKRAVLVTRWVMAGFLQRNLHRGMVVAHECDNPACVNPAHLKEASQSENLKDAYRRGRLPTTFAASA